MTQTSAHCAYCTYEHDHINIFRIWVAPYSRYCLTDFTHKGLFMSHRECCAVFENSCIIPSVALEFVKSNEIISALQQYICD